MTDLFAFGRAVEGSADSAYGLSGDMKKTQYILQLLGSPADIDTLKCLIIAVEAGLETDSAALDIVAKQHESSGYLTVSPFGLLPTLKEADYLVSGKTAVMAYIEARGLGKRLVPKNVALLAEQNYWSDIACSDVQPYVECLLQEKVLAVMANPDHIINESLLASAREAMSPALDAFNQQLADKAFIIGDFSFADIHWTACLHLLQLAGEESLISERVHAKSWFERIRNHQSHSGQNIVAYELLPTLGDILNKRLHSVEIDDY